MATIAPVIVSLALWLITQSVFALVFAALGPAVAIASLADARLQSRRRSRRERLRFDGEVAATRRDLEAAHDRERASLAVTAPAAARLVDGSWSESEQWLGALGDVVAVSIGRGERASGVVLDGMPSPSRANGDYNDALRALVAEAGTVSDAPVVVDARLGIGIVGAPEVRAAAARSVLVQILATLPPAAHGVTLSAPPRDPPPRDPTPRDTGAAASVEDALSAGCAAPAHDWSWLEGLPHTLAHDDRGERGRVIVTVSDSATQIVVATAPDRDALPRAARIVVRVTGLRGDIEQHPDPALLGPVGVALTSREQAAAVVRRFADHAAREGLVGGGAIADEVAFDDCATSPSGERRGGLDCAVAVAATGVVTIDLVEHGPHAVVGGTTGSGKSELLTAWVLAMARAHSPREASVLLVDFKGGSAFASLASLPHCVGVLTDLDETSAHRALESLAAELRRRERLLAAAGAKSIDAQDSGLGQRSPLDRDSHLAPNSDLGQGADLARGARLPRLVIVVDEFAAMVSGFPELHGLFGDIAARGRSLGVHLILCTQRPAGVIRDAVLANSAIRISLRVNNRADSTAVIGTDAAAALPLTPRGRALVCTDGGEPVLAQFPLVTAADVAAVTRAWAHDGFRPHRPWLDPLPPTIERRQLGSVGADATAATPANTAANTAAGGIAFGVLDDPANQSQPVAYYRPAEHGNLLVLGGAGSGKSTLLDSLAAGVSTGTGTGTGTAAGTGTGTGTATGTGTRAGIGTDPGAHARLQRLPQHVEGAWDALVALVADIRSADAPLERIVMLDDLDVVVSRYGDDYESAVLDLLTQCLREGPARGIHFVVAAQRLTAALHTVAALCGSRLLLRLPSRQEHVLAGGDGQDFGERLPPGAGRWLGLRVQVARPDAGEHDPDPRDHTTRPAAEHDRAPRDHATHRHAPQPTLDLTRPLAVVSTRHHTFVERLRSAFPELTPASITVLGDDRVRPAPDIAVSVGTRPAVVVGDLEAWQAQWGSLAALRSTHTVIVDGCSAGEFRSVTRSRLLPPPIAADGDAFWVLAGDGHVSRVRLPGH